jgi:membrane-associated protease RseP (regulator of RpoE activity)
MSDYPTSLTFQQARDLLTTEANALADEINELIAPDMLVESTQIPREQSTSGVVVFRGRLLRPSHEVFPRWLSELNSRGYTPLLRPIPGGDPNFVALRIMAGIAPEAHPRQWINGLLFALTVLSTLFVGSMYSPDLGNVTNAWELFLPQNLLKGLPFAATLLGILGAHEFGHYFAARYHNVAVTLPYFIPLPLPPFGTMGAFIQLKEPVPDRRRLFDIGVAGPLAGLVLAVPLLFYGLSTSPMEVPVFSEGSWLEGNSILYFFAKFWIFGKPLPDLVTGEDVLMNQVTTAAWAGLLVTALNLLPVGQLDGGHTVFALFGEKARYINRITIGVLATLGVAGIPMVQEFLPRLVWVGWMGWFFWLVLIFAVIGPYHPPALDDVTELDRRRRWIGYAMIAIFILIFMPVPLRVL